jgi:hypothetical protein
VVVEPDFETAGDGRPTNSEIGQNAVLRFSPAQQRAMVEAVHDAGKIIQTHQTSAEAIRIVLEVGVDMAQHCASTGPVPMEESTIQLMLDKKFYCGTQWRALSPEEEKQVRDGNFGTNYNLQNQIRLLKAGALADNFCEVGLFGWRSSPPRSSISTGGNIRASGSIVRSARCAVP